MNWRESKISKFEEIEGLVQKQTRRICSGAQPTVPCVLGVDEAGRGPVLGPMVYGIAFCPIEDSNILKDLGCADSKSLTEDKRETILKNMIEDTDKSGKIGWAVDIIPPNYISNCMLRRNKYSLNEISMSSAINLIKEANDAGVNISEIYVDTVGPPEKYQEKLSRLFPNFKITVAKKADSTYPIVSAASIAAKVIRDLALKNWKFIEDINLTQDNFGSGYPGDPVTKKFIKEQLDPVFGYPEIVRFSWSTAELVMKESGYNFIWEEDDTDKKRKKKSPVTNSKRISSFFSTSNETNNDAKLKRHSFFKERHLKLVEDF